MTKNNDLYQYEDLKILVKEFYPLDNNIKILCKEIKSRYKNINIVIVNPSIVFGLEHLLSIIKIINEKIKRKEKREIKNLDIEFLLRICYTNQIANAFQKLDHDKDKNNDDNRYICILFSEHSSHIENAFRDLKKYERQENSSEEEKQKEELRYRAVNNNLLIEISEKKNNTF